MSRRKKGIDATPAAAPSPLDPDRTTLEPGQVREVQVLATTMLALAKGASDEELAALGVPPESVADLRLALAGARQLPRARDLILGSMGGALSGEFALTAYARAQRGLHALAPLVALRLAEHVDGSAGTKGDVRVLLALAKGLGLLTPAEAVDPERRRQLMSIDDHKGKTDEELKLEILGRSA